MGPFGENSAVRSIDDSSPLSGCHSFSIHPLHIDGEDSLVDGHSDDELVRWCPPPILIEMVCVCLPMRVCLTDGHVRRFGAGNITVLRGMPHSSHSCVIESRTPPVLRSRWQIGLVIRHQACICVYNLGVVGLVFVERSCA